MRITLVIGLPASGKSTFAQTLGADVIIDDPKAVSEIYNVKDVSHLVIIDQFLCDDDYLRLAELILETAYPTATIERIYFANDPQQCIENAKLRPDKLVTGQIKLMSEYYNPPRDARPVWRIPVYSQLIIDRSGNRWAIYYPDYSRFDGKTYKTSSAAKRALTYYKRHI